MQNNNDNPRQGQELWQKLKLQTTKTTKKLKTWIVALPKNQMVQYLTKGLCVFVVAYCTIKLLSTIQTLLPIVITIYLAKMLYQNGYKLNNKISKFLIKHDFINSAPKILTEPKLTFSETDISGISNWSFGKYTGEYQVVRGHTYFTTKVMIFCDQNNKKLFCKVEDLRETIQELIK